jgi:putative MATE family efflux protein
LGASEVVQKDATRYFFIFALFLPALQINSLAGMMLQNSGDMRTPAWLDAAMCGLDVGFNFIFIRYWGVAGAALGTALAEAVICIIKLYVVSCKSPLLHLKRKEACPYDKNILRKMLRIGVPMAFEHTAICGAMILVTTFITSLGTVPMAAHSIAVTAESVCYMPGYGIAAAATLLTGQSFGAKKEALGKSFSDLAILLGCAVMTLAAVLVYFICPFIFSILTPDKEVQLLAARALRIQLLAEPLYAVAIVASGSLRGIGDTLIPSILNLISLWGVRITLAFLLVRQWGLPGVWFAMGAELCVRGLLMLFRQQTKLRPPETMPTLVYEGIGLENEQKIEK